MTHSHLKYVDPFMDLYAFMDFVGLVVAVVLGVVSTAIVL